MPVVQEAKPRPLCPAGIQEFVLADVTPKMMPSFNGEGETERWIWRFVGNKKDETGQFYEVPVFTGTTYGDPRAKLTWLLDLLLPNATEAEKKRLDTDTLLGCHWEGSVKHEAGVKDPTQKFAAFAYLRPLGNEGAPDPFAFDQDGAVHVCEECEQELTEAEIKASRKRWPDTLLCAAHGKIKVQAEKADKVVTGAPVAA